MSLIALVRARDGAHGRRLSLIGTRGKSSRDSVSAGIQNKNKVVGDTSDWLLTAMADRQIE
jgi:hypothetical protein